MSEPLQSHWAPSQTVSKAHRKGVRGGSSSNLRRTKRMAVNKSRARMNFPEACEAAVNDQIMMELGAYYKYLSISSWLNRDDVSLPGLAKYYYETAVGEQAHAKKLIDLMAIRGGHVIYKQLDALPTEWGCAANVLATSLQIERDVNESLLRVHHVAEENDDPALMDFIEGEFLRSQNEQIKKAADLLTQLEHCGSEGLGLYLFDKQFLQGYESEYEEGHDDKKKSGY